MLSDNCGISFHRGIVLPTCLGRRKGWGWLDKARLLLQGAGPLARWQGGVLPEISQQGPSGPTPIRDWGEWDKFSGRAQHLLFAEALGAWAWSWANGWCGKEDRKEPVRHPYHVPNPRIRIPEARTSLASCPEGQRSPPGTGRERRAQRGEGTCKTLVSLGS